MPGKIKVLFVSSGNFEKFDIAPFIKSQAESLRKNGLEVAHYPIRGKGLYGYLKNILPLRREIRKGNYDLVHAHYSLCGIASILASSKPVILSLMGSDVNGSFMGRLIIRFLAYLCNIKIIVKSQEMKTKLALKRALVIANGIDLTQFSELIKEKCREMQKLSLTQKYVLFAARADRPVKNFALANAAFDIIETDNVKLMTINNEPHEQIPSLINASDVLILTSLWEGSPNIIKEAMACNCPIVSTDVGDVRWLLGDIEGHYIAKNDPQDFAVKLEMALRFGKRTKGRERLIELGLDSDTVARRLIELYQKVLERTKRLRAEDEETKRRRD